MKTVNVLDLRDYAVRDNVERGRIYLYVYAGLNSASYLLVDSPLIQRSAQQTHGFSYEGSEKKEWGFFSLKESYFGDSPRREWHYATDAGVHIDRRRNGNFMLDIADLYAEGIIAEAGGTVYLPA